jgi:hypothetical protein
VVGAAAQLSVVDALTVPEDEDVDDGRPPAPDCVVSEGAYEGSAIAG